MHAVVVNDSIEPGHEDEAAERLHTDVVPRVKEAPGIVCGNWLVPSEGKGFSLVVFESEAAAKAMVEGMSAMPWPDFVKLDKVEVREVAAHI